MRDMRNTRCRFVHSLFAMKETRNAVGEAEATPVRWNESVRPALSHSPTAITIVMTSGTSARSRHIGKRNRHRSRAAKCVDASGSRDLRTVRRTREHRRHVAIQIRVSEVQQWRNSDAW